jgi:NitT/TauT family transport system permease protein
MVKNLIQSILFVVLVLAVWEYGARAEWWQSYLFPAPSTIAQYLKDALLDGTLWSASLVTLRRLFLGYLIGVIVGIPLGLLVSRVKVVNNTLGVIALGLQGLPSVCWVPLAVLWFGQEEASILFVVVMGTVWSVIIATGTGLSNVPPIYSRAAQTMGASPLYTLVFVTLPASAPFVVSGMKQGWAFAWRSLMSAEIFVPILSGLGLGQLLHFGRELNSMEQVLGIMFVIIIIGLLSDKLIFSPLEGALHKRWGTNRG